MPIEVFALRDQVVGEYRDYVSSFINIPDDRIDGFVKKELDGGRLWPEAVFRQPLAPVPRILRVEGESAWNP